MPRVIHVLAPARHGGLERVVESLARGQQRRRGDVHIAAVLTPDDATKHPFVERIRASGVSITTIIVESRHYLRERRMLRGLMREFGPAVVHSHGYRADIVAGSAARSVGYPLVSTLHGFTGNAWRNRLNERLQLLSLRRADAIIAVALPMLGRLVKTGLARDRIHVIPNAFVPAVPFLPREDARRQLGLSTSGKTAAWLGRLSPEKGPDVMLDALALTESSWNLSMMGDGRARARLERLAFEKGLASRVHWHGMVPQGGSLLRAFDAFVLSSRTEGTPIALLEAMAAGTPIVATRVGGVPDVVRATEAILVESENVQAIARALEELASDPVATAARSTAAARRVTEHYGEEPWLDAVERVYGIARADRP